MTHTVERLPDEPILIITYETPFDFHIEPGQILEAMADIIIDSDQAVFAIHDTSNLSLSFSDVVTGMAGAFKNVRGQELSPRARILVVGGGTLLNLAVRSARQIQYGGLDVELFDSLDDALDYARQYSLI